MAIIHDILSAKQQSRKLLALLVDPEKQVAPADMGRLLRLPDMIFVGGSTGACSDAYISQLRAETDRPILLFPGNITQFTPAADALLFLTLLNARIPEVLVMPHIQVAKQVLQSGIEAISMGYILVDGGHQSSVERATHCTPIPQSDTDTILSTAIAGQLMGKKLIYLEAGSGAHMPVSTDIIHTVSQHLSVPLIVGGGICTPKAMIAAFEAGADIVVIGNHFEQKPDEIADFVRIKREKYE
jgi:putative glycerol-1-phosphate prenyltransferase